MKKIKTIIIGAGISGLSCAQRLAKHDGDFLVLYKHLGGRMLVCKCDTVNFGASYVTEDYKNVSKYIGHKNKISVRDCYFLVGQQYKTLLHSISITNISKLWKLYLVLRDFRKRLNLLRKRSLTISQKEAVMQDPVLFKYIHEPASVFIREHSLADLNHVFFNPLFNSTGFLEYEKSNVFFYLYNLMPIISKTYTADFSKTLERLTDGIKDKMINISVKSITKVDKGYKVTTAKNIYLAKNIVLALPYTDAIKIYKQTPHAAHINPIYVLHVAGRRKKLYANKKVIFLQPEKHTITIMWQQDDNSDVIFSKVRNPDLKKYYTKHEILRRVFWKTATVLSDSCFVPQKFAKNLYLASDYNICGLEDSCITGIYAANQILKRK